MWTIEVAGTSKATILVKDGTPIARFYAERFTPEMLQKIKQALNEAGA